MKFTQRLTNVHTVEHEGRRFWLNTIGETYLRLWLTDRWVTIHIGPKIEPAEPDVRALLDQLDIDAIILEERL